MSFAVGRIYVENHFNEDSRAAAYEMIFNIRKEFKKMITEYTWMDGDSKKTAEKKVLSIYLERNFS